MTAFTALQNVTHAHDVHGKQPAAKQSASLPHELIEMVYFFADIDTRRVLARAFGTDAFRIYKVRCHSAHKRAMAHIHSARIAKYNVNKMIGGQ
jgi:hypothetical protein